MTRTIGAVVGVLCALAATPALAARLRLSTPTSSMGVGQRFEVKVSLDTEGERVNAVSGTLAFSDDALRLEGIDDANSVVPLWIERPHAVASGVAFAGIVPGGYDGKDGLLLTLSFRSVDAGNAEIALRSATLLRDDGQGSEVAVTATPLTLTVDRSASAVTGGPSSPDRVSPEPFVPRIAKDPSLFDGGWFVSFAATDKGAGIDRYAVKEAVSPLLAPFTAWKDARSPYPLDDQSLGSFVYVRAIDRSGNGRVERVDPRHPLSWGRYAAVASAALIGAAVASAVLFRRRRTRR